MFRIPRKSRPQQEKLTEQWTVWHTEASHVDREQMQVQNIVLAGLESRNGYRYRETALQQAVPLYENRPVFLDHARNRLRPHERSARDLVGSVRNVRYEQGRIRGDIQVLNTDSGRTFLALVESNTKAVGMSHVVLATRNPDQTIVEQILEVISVDAVVFPATTHTFREQQDEFPLEGEWIPDSYEALLTLLDEALSQLPDAPIRVATFESFLITATSDSSTQNSTQTDQWTDSDLPQHQLRGWEWNNKGQLTLTEPLLELSREELQEGSWRDRLDEVPAAFPEEAFPNEESLASLLRAEQFKERHWRQRYQRLLRKYADLQQRQHSDVQLERLLEQAALPAYAITSQFRQMLQEARSPLARESLIRERQQLCRQLQLITPASAPRVQNSETGLEEALIRAIRK